MILILNILDMILIFCGSSYVLQGKCFSWSWVIKRRMSLIETPIIMPCTTMEKLLLEQFINAQMIIPSIFFSNYGWDIGGITWIYCKDSVSILCVYRLTEKITRVFNTWIYHVQYCVYPWKIIIIGNLMEKSKEISELIEHTYSQKKPYTVSFIYISHDTYKQFNTRCSKIIWYIRKIVNV